jgi:hypothetical protein
MILEFRASLVQGVRKVESGPARMRESQQSIYTYSPRFFGLILFVVSSVIIMGGLSSTENQKVRISINHQEKKVLQVSSNEHAVK